MRQGSKLARLIDMLRRERGATVAEAVAALGCRTRGLCDQQEFGAGDETGWLGVIHAMEK